MTLETVFDLYKLVEALRLHFQTDTYDYFKYNGSIHRKEEKFQENKSKFHYVKLFEKFKRTNIDPVDFIVATMVSGKYKWIGDISTGHKNYLASEKKFQSFEYMFEQDIARLYSENPSFSQWIKPNPEEYPDLLIEIITEKLSLETMIVLDDIFKLFDEVWKKYDDGMDSVFKGLQTKVQKYRPFVLNKVGKTKKYAKILLNVFRNT